MMQYESNFPKLRKITRRRRGNYREKNKSSISTSRANSSLRILIIYILDPHEDHAYIKNGKRKVTCKNDF